ncbi:MAG: hypothetical protein MJ072_01610 [Clostridia bacterium]|nr:hypothetical protein [Clostridia bacterium]
MERISIDFNKVVGKMKIMHAVNNGPEKQSQVDQNGTNFSDYKAARIPYARNHDAAFYSSYGGEHTVDVNNIFRNFDADENDPASYDFVLTDFYIENTLAAGTETFYRLGAKIEHEIKKYNTLPPKDFNKWARICEHIIRHMNEGWADGHHYGIKYWEIWNEPDLDDGTWENKRTWGGSRAQFFDLFEITAKHLKSCFPELKIGGPAIAGWIEWGDDFLAEMKKRNVPIDFFSWHIYADEPCKVTERAYKVQEILTKNGYGNVESILNEWNYVKGWTDEFVYSIDQILSIKGATFTADVMVRSQNAPIDMLMYYDARPTCFNGLWDRNTFRKLKGYYPFYIFADLYELKNQVECNCEGGRVNAIASADGKGKCAVMLTNYTDNDEETELKAVAVELGEKFSSITVKMTNKDDTMKETVYNNIGTVTFEMRPNSFAEILLEK